MSFTTLPFLVLVALSVAAYYLLPQRVQWMALLAASMVFYCVGGGKTVLYVFYTAVIVYGSGLLLGRFNDLRRAAPKEEKKAITARYKPYRRAVVLVACLANFGLLYVLKYWNFTADLFQPLADQLRPGTQIPLSELVLPLGISFFMFQSVGYVIDVYRDKYAPEKNFAKLLLFVSFFPQMVQGPISRFNDLAPQLFARRSLDSLGVFQKDGDCGPGRRAGEHRAGRPLVLQRQHSRGGCSLLLYSAIRGFLRWH